MDDLKIHKLAKANIEINKKLDKLIDDYEYESVRLCRPVTVETMLKTLKELKNIVNIKEDVL